jgi:DNA helicase-2/ATP-dependent DNA helicase PcrA
LPRQIDGDETLAIIRKLRERLRDETGVAAAARVNAKVVADRIDLVRSRLLRPDELDQLGPASRSEGPPDWVVAPIMRWFAEYKLERNLIDFVDQVELAAEILATPAGDLIRDEITEVYVDEAQDLTPLDWVFLGRLAGRATRAAVGDPRQAINEWRGAKPDVFERFFEKAEVRLDLLANHRSRRPIIDAANAMMRKYPPIHCLLGDGPPVRVRRYGGKLQQDTAIAEAIVELVARGVPDDEIAVLSKTNDAVARIAHVLTEAGVDNRRLGLRPLHTTSAFSVATAALSAAMIDEVGSATQAAAVILGEVQQRGSDGPGEVLSEEDLDDWSRLVAAIDDQERAGIREPRAIFDAIAKAERAATAGSGVTVSTMAGSKGLEWEVVFLADATAGNLFAKGPEDESRRVFYVAITRARRELHVTWDGERPSEFLEEAGLLPQVEGRR